MVGRRLAHYEIVARLGEGGMGVVWKARDTRLDRFAAIKVLRTDAAADADRKRRFTQEAKAASALNHPGIVTIYDIADEEGISFIAMEYVQGQTLADLIGRRGLPVATALNYAIQAAQALAKAHAAGIVHRDLKPSNIMVTGDGLVKILDFGVAKLAQPAGQPDDTRAETRTMSTADPPRTEEGKVVGTAAYMSPEQAEGRPVDARSDIFSFGAVLYEMVTGTRLFQETSSASTLAAVLAKEPAPPSQLVRDVPRDLERIILRCLRKDPARRVQVMADLAVELEEIKAESGSQITAVSPVAPVFRPRRRRWVAAAGGGLLLASVGAYTIWPSAPPPTAAVKVVALTSLAGRESYPTFSPDGTQVAFSWNGENEDNDDIYVRLVNGGTALRVTTDPAPDQAVAWSPDGSMLAFVRGGFDAAAIYLTTPLGGAERRLASVRLPRADTPRPSLSWSPDSKWLVTAQTGPDGTTSIIVLIPIGQGEARTIASRPVAEGRYFWPVLSPAGNMLASVSCPTRAGWSCFVEVTDLGPDFAPLGAPRRLNEVGMDIRGVAWTPDGQEVVYGGSPGAMGRSYLWRAPATGGAEVERIEVSGTGAAYPAMSKAHGSLAYAQSYGDMDIWRFDEGGTAGPSKSLSSTLDDGDPRFSPDGSRVAFISGRMGRGMEIFVAPADGSLHAVQVTQQVARQVGSPRWSPDGQRLAFDAQGGDGDWDIWTIDAAGGQATRLTEYPGEEQTPSWSADGRWIYFGSDQTGRFEVWRVPSSGGPGQQMTTTGGNRPWESGDGRELFYLCCSIGVRRAVFARTLPDGPERLVLELAPTGQAAYVPVKEGIYYITRPDPSRPRAYELQFFEFATASKRTLTKFEATNVGIALTVSPDRRTALWNAGQIGVDLRLIENFR